MIDEQRLGIEPESAQSAGSVAHITKLVIN
jgi:hypothetical protein